MGKILCPRHKDTHPSCEVYENGAYCFSGCGPISLEELGLEGQAPPPKPKEDIEKSLGEISRLPRGEFRGFEFPYDPYGFYLVWPSAPFYKKRLLNPKSPIKYLAPTGHKPPLFWARKESLPTLCIVEGELEALSLARAVETWDVVSPGSATNFICHKAFFKYSSVIIAADNDSAGIKAAQDVASQLVAKVPHLVVFYKDKERDFNKVLCDQGVSGLINEVERRLSQGVCWENPE